MGLVSWQVQGVWSGPLLWSGWLLSSSTKTPQTFIQIHLTNKTDLCIWKCGVLYWYSILLIPLNGRHNNHNFTGRQIERSWDRWLLGRGSCTKIEIVAETITKSFVWPDCHYTVAMLQTIKGRRLDATNCCLLSVCNKSQLISSPNLLIFYDS